MKTPQTTPESFRSLDLPEPLQKTLEELGYEIPFPIQSRMIPVILEGRDVVGQAQTGTGKTAAFALPLLAKLNLKKQLPQVLVLAPTRELAIQVAEAFQKYAAHLKGFHVLPIYGGQEYGGQLRGLSRGAHVIVGTPGRVMDHIERGTLKLEELTCLVLDEADEMLKMGFKEDVEWILEHTPSNRQIALFSATMPIEIRHIAKKYLKDPEEISIQSKTTTVETTRQRYWLVSGLHRLDALTRILEAEPFDGIIIFVRTKLATLDLAEKLQARGFPAAPLNGDIPQNQRERTIDQLKSGKLNILVATDVAARGLDVERISHVINYDIPHDTEAYIHRIGRTGRAGRSGEAILFVSPREKRLLMTIEKATRQKIEMMQIPTSEVINDKRIANFKQKITDTLATDDWHFFRDVLEQYSQEHNVPPLDIAAALARLFQGEQPLLLESRPEKLEVPERFERPERSERSGRQGRPDRSDRPERSERPAKPYRERESFPTKKEPGKRGKVDEHGHEEGMERFRIEVGRQDGVQPNNIVGAIAGETGIAGREIGRIKIYPDYSTVDLPEGMPDQLFRKLKKAWIAGKEMGISRMDEHAKPPRPEEKHEKKYEDKRERKTGEKPPFRSKPRREASPSGKKSER